MGPRRCRKSEVATEAGDKETSSMKKTICRFTGVVVVERSCHKWISELLACDSETHLEFGVKLRDPAIEHAHGG